MLDTPWERFRRRVRPVTRRIPYGHVVAEAATYTRLWAPSKLQPDQRFVIFAQGRSGSTLLADLLNSHPRIFCADEPLTWKRRDPVRYAAACSVGHRGDTYGFKVKIYQLTDAQHVEPGTFLRSMAEAGWHIVHLQRRNVLRQALSSMVAEQRDRYHNVDGSWLEPVQLDARALLARTRARVGYCEAEAEALRGVEHLSLGYEDDLLSPDMQQATASRVFGFLGLEDVEVTTILQKIGSRSLDRDVANADEVRDVLLVSEFAGLLEAD